MLFLGGDGFESLVTVPALERSGVPILMAPQFAPHGKSGQQNTHMIHKYE
jgi:hypothetical protein